MEVVTPSLAALIKRAVDERAWRECHMMLKTPHDPQDLEKAEAELEAKFRSLIREEIEDHVLLKHHVYDTL